MTALYLLPAALSALVLAAHFLRGGNYLVVLALLAFVPLLAVRRRWVPVVVRLTLWLGAAVWLYTLARFAAERMRLGEPWLRLAVILGGVAAFTALSALPLWSPRLRTWYHDERPKPSDGKATSAIQGAAGDLSA